MPEFFYELLVCNEAKNYPYTGDWWTNIHVWSCNEFFLKSSSICCSFYWKFNSYIVVFTRVHRTYTLSKSIFSFICLFLQCGYILSSKKIWSHHWTFTGSFSVWGFIPNRFLRQWGYIYVNVSICREEQNKFSKMFTSSEDWIWNPGTLGHLARIHSYAFLTELTWQVLIGGI